jgi:hypothetical protein
VKELLAALNGLIMNFVSNPIFKNSDAVDPQQAAQARRDLDGIISLSEKMKKTADKL